MKVKHNYNKMTWSNNKEKRGTGEHFYDWKDQR